jgi:hypothetical protein
MKKKKKKKHKVIGYPLRKCAYQAFIIQKLNVMTLDLNWMWMYVAFGSIDLNLSNYA